MSLTDFFINKAITSGFVKSRLQAAARVVVMSLGTYLVQHGLANQEIASTITGALLGIVAIYLQDLDVKVVDGKIKVALNTTGSTGETDPIIPVTVQPLPPISGNGKNGKV